VRLPPGGAVTGWASLRLRGGAFFDGLAPDGRTRLPVPLAVGQGSKLRGDHRVALSREPLNRDETEVLHGVVCTTVCRALFDEMRRVRDLREAVVAMDMAAAALLVSVARMHRFLDTHRSWRRSTLVADALELASERSMSPNETRTRLIWRLDARLPVPLVNQEIWDHRGRLLGVADLLDVEAGLVGEFDGADHRQARRHAHDIAREVNLRRAELEVFRVAGPDLADRAMVAERMHFHRGRARWLPPHERPWTIVPPSGWQREQTLDEYLEEQEFRRELHAAHERDTPDIRELRGW
jgi:hypothetical protein